MAAQCNLCVQRPATSLYIPVPAHWHLFTVIEGFSHPLALGRRAQRESRGLTLSFCCITAALCALFSLWIAWPKTFISGHAIVIDGDTLQVEVPVGFCFSKKIQDKAVLDIAVLSTQVYGNTVRLQGIDAPEWNQTCRTSKGRVYRCGATASLTSSMPETCP